MNMVIKRQNRNIVIILLLLVSSNFFRGQTFFNIINSQIFGIRIQYLLIFLAFLFIKSMKHKIKTIFSLLIVFIILLVNYFFSYYYNISYLIYIGSFIVLISTWKYILGCQKRKIITKAINAFLTFVIILGLYEIVRDTTLFHNAPPYVFNSVYHRAFLFFFNPNNYSYFLLNLYIAKLYIEDNYYFNYKDCIYAGAITYILICNTSRLSLFVFLVIISIQILLTVRKSYLKLLAIAFIFSIFIFSYDVSDQLINIISNIGGIDDLTGDTRFYLYKNVIDSIFIHPLGLGMGSGDIMLSTAVHSIIFQVIFEFGWIGLIFWVSYYFYLMYLLLKRFKDKRSATIIIYSMTLPITSMQVSRILSDTSLLFIASYFYAELALIKEKRINKKYLENEKYIATNEKPI